MNHETRQENRINDALRTLGEEFRMGMVAVEEYRVRRRGLLESWGERDITTSPGSSIAKKPSESRPTQTRTPIAAAPAVRSAPGPASSPVRPFLIGAAAAAILLGAGAYWYFKHSPKPGASATSPVPVPVPVQRSAELIAITQAAAEFLDRNRWEPEDLAAFAQSWHALPAPQQAAARQEPSLKSLRHELEQNIQAESQALNPDADTLQRRRLDSLVQFARELDRPV